MVTSSGRGPRALSRSPPPVRDPCAGRARGVGREGRRSTAEAASSQGGPDPYDDGAGGEETGVCDGDVEPSAFLSVRTALRGDDDSPTSAAASLRGTRVGAASNPEVSAAALPGDGGTGATRLRRKETQGERRRRGSSGDHCPCERVRAPSARGPPSFQLPRVCRARSARGPIARRPPPRSPEAVRPGPSALAWREAGHGKRQVRGRGRGDPLRTDQALLPTENTGWRRAGARGSGPPAPAAGAVEGGGSGAWREAASGRGGDRLQRRGRRPFGEGLDSLAEDRDRPRDHPENGLRLPLQVSTYIGTVFPYNEALRPGVIFLTCDLTLTGPTIRFLALREVSSASFCGWNLWYRR